MNHKEHNIKVDFGVKYIKSKFIKRKKFLNILQNEIYFNLTAILTKIVLMELQILSSIQILEF